MMLQWALGYAAIGWPVFRLSGKKTPIKDSHGYLDATTDAAVLRSWWAEGADYPNIGFACGAVLALDADGPGGLAEFERIGAPHGGWPRTWTAKTARGRHFFYRCPPGVELRSHNQARAEKGSDGLDLRGTGGYVMVVPSVNRKAGVRMAWEIGPHEMPEGPAELPPWAVEWWKNRTGANRLRLVVPDSVPANSDNSRQLATVLGEPPPWVARDAIADTISARELGDIIDALKKIPPNLPYHDWYKAGAAIHEFDPSLSGLALFQAWSRTSPAHAEESVIACEKKWLEYQKPKPGKVLITRATLHDMAKRDWVKEWKEFGIGEAPKLLQVEAKTELARTAQPITINGKAVAKFNFTAKVDTDYSPMSHFPDLAGTAANPIVKPTAANALVALRKLGVLCRKDLFHDRITVQGHAIEAWVGDLTDDLIHLFRRMAKETWGFDPGEKNMRDASIQQALEHQYNPVIDYLDGLSWDGRARLDRWLSTYMNAEDTPLTQAIGALALAAAVRRARIPGYKFDQIVVLESGEGKGKSSAIEILAGAENFSDQSILTLDDRAQQEQLKGVWLYEIADLAGITKADVERIKAFASRRVDRARPAYGHYRVDRPRTCIIFASTNDSTYLMSQTGNRRFWPVGVGRANLDALARDRDQLWAEAAVREQQGGTLVLPERLWREAAAEQDRRLESDPWDSIVETIAREPVASPSGLGKEMRISTRELLDAHIQLPRGQQTTASAKRLAHCMRRHGWNGPATFRDGEKTTKGYFKLVSGNLSDSGNV